MRHGAKKRERRVHHAAGVTCQARNRKELGREFVKENKKKKEKKNSTKKKRKQGRKKRTRPRKRSRKKENDQEKKKKLSFFDLDELASSDPTFTESNVQLRNEYILRNFCYVFLQ